MAKLLFSPDFRWGVKLTQKQRCPSPILVQNPSRIWIFSCPDSYLDSVWTRLKPDSSLDRVWTKSKKYFRNQYRRCPDWDLVPDLDLDWVWKNSENIFEIRPDSVQTWICTVSGPDKKQIWVWTESEHRNPWTAQNIGIHGPIKIKRSMDCEGFKAWFYREDHVIA